MQMPLENGPGPYQLLNSIHQYLGEYFCPRPKTATGNILKTAAQMLYSIPALPEVTKHHVIP